MTNHPIFKDKVEWTQKKLERFLTVFNFHHIDWEFLSGDKMKTTHIFRDGLKIVFYWNMKDKKSTVNMLPVQRDKFSSVDLFNMQDLEYIEYEGHEFLSYSLELLIRYGITQHMKQEFEYVLKADEFNYHDLEFNVKEKSNIPDSFFDDLLYSLHCLTKFEEYLGIKK